MRERKGTDRGDIEDERQREKKWRDRVEEWEKGGRDKRECEERRGRDRKERRE